MNNETGKAPVICEECERVFYGGVNAYLCPECRKKRLAGSDEKNNEKKKGDINNEN
jgi:Zn finger protein HypA/HybF involved in hydrogenase expression